MICVLLMQALGKRTLLTLRYIRSSWLWEGRIGEGSHGLGRSFFSHYHDNQRHELQCRVP